VVVAVVFVGAVQPALDQVVDVIAVRDRLVSAPLLVRVPRIAADRVRMSSRVDLVDSDHVLVEVPVVRVVEMSLVQVVDVTVVADRDVATTGSVLVRVLVFVDLVGHAPTIGRTLSSRKADRRGAGAWRDDGQGRQRRLSAARPRRSWPVQVDR
jgi:hypothetical protein